MPNISVIYLPATESSGEPAETSPTSPTIIHSLLRTTAPNPELLTKDTVFQTTVTTSSSEILPSPGNDHEQIPCPLRQRLGSILSRDRELSTASSLGIQCEEDETNL